MAGSKNYLVRPIYSLCRPLRRERARTNQTDVQCKHLLAVVMAHYTDRAVCTQVRFDGVVDLLGLKNAPAGHGGVLV